jgi:hypothetical protein
MSSQTVFDGSGRRAGYYKETSDVIYAHDVNGKNAGYYKKSTNTTFDRNGRRYGSGNLVTSLIMETYQSNR